MRGRSIGIAAIASLLVGACQTNVVPTPSSAIASPSSPPSASPEVSASPSPVAGGCGSTQVYAGPGPDAHLGLWDNPWAAATPTDAGIVAYFWYPPPEVIFATGPGGDAPKVLWISHTQIGRLSVTAHPLGAASPAVRYELGAPSSPRGNYPSGIELPSPGCWHFDLELGTAAATMDLLVAPPRPLASPFPMLTPSTSSPLSSWSTDIFAVTGLEAARIATVVRFVSAFNAARIDHALAAFAVDAALNDCDFATHEIVEARGRAAIRAWLVQRFADHDRLVIARIFNMNPDPNSNQGVGVDFALRTSDTIARLGASNGIVPQGEAKVVFDPSGQRISTFANAPGGAPRGVVLNMCSVPTPTNAPAPTPPG